VSIQLLTVVADYVVRSNHGEKDVLLLWENMSPAGFDSEASNLRMQLDEGPVDYDLNQRGWENWQSTLARVCFFFLVLC